MLRSERDMLRKRCDNPISEKRVRHAYGCEQITRDVQRISRQLWEETELLMRLVVTVPSSQGVMENGGAEMVPADTARQREEALQREISDVEAQHKAAMEEIRLLQDDCADLAGEVTRLEDLNFLAETALLKYAGYANMLSLNAQTTFTRTHARTQAGRHACRCTLTDSLAQRAGADACSARLVDRSSPRARGAGATAPACVQLQ